MGISTPTNGRVPGLFLQFPEDFSLLFFYFCMCPCLFSEWPKRGRGAAGGEGTALPVVFFSKLLFVDFFFPKPFVSPTQLKDGKLSFSLKKKRLFLFLFQRQNGKVVP